MTKVFTAPVFGSFVADTQQQNFLAQTGGMYTIKLPKEVLEAAIQQAEASGNEEIVKFNKSLPTDEYIIVTQEGYREFMGEQLYETILTHEEGHIHYDHLKDVDMTKGGIIVDIEKELEADLYSAKIHGAKVMAKALVRALEYSLYVRFGYLPSYESKKRQWMKELLSEAGVTTRLKTLFDLHENEEFPTLKEAA